MKTFHITFLNDSSENNLVERATKYMESRIEDFENYIKHGTSLDDAKSSGKVSKKAKKFFESTGELYNYGLSYGYSERDKKEDEDYFRYQLSWGGPSDEVRFYEDGTIEYVFLDWFCGVGFDVTGETWAQWLKDWFNGCDMMNFEEKRGDSDYYAFDYEDEEEDED